MLVSAKDMLTKAKAGHYAVGHFNINNLEWAKAILLTAQEMNSPVILGVSEGAGKYMCGFKTVADMVKAMVESLGITVPVDDESEKEFSYYFKRPTVPSYDRYIKTAAQGITKASKAFMLDAVIDEDAERLTKDMEENPGIAISIGNKLTEILGLTGTANLKKL